MAFDFPNPPSAGQEVTNSATGVTYKYDTSTQSWVIVASSITDDYATNAQLTAEATTRDAEDSSLRTSIAQETDLRIAADAGLTTRIDALENAPAPSQLTYQIGTDKVMRAGDPSIELVDSEGYYSNVKFRGLGGVVVTSDLQSIIIDGSGIDAGTDVNLNNYYTKDEIDQQFGYQGLGYYFLLSNISGYVTIRPGEWSSDNRIVGQITQISLAPEDEHGANVRTGVQGDIINIVDPATNREYQYTVTTAMGTAYVVQYTDSEEKRNDTLSVGSPNYIYIYPTHITAADYYTKTKANELFLKKTDGTQQTLASDVKYNGAISAYNHIVNKEYVDNAIASVQSIDDTQVDQNEEQLQALSTALFNAQNKIQQLESLDIQNALSALATARQDIIDLKSKVLSLEQQIVLNLE